MAEDAVTEEQMKEFRKTFDKFDKNGDGKIPSSELKSALEDLGGCVSDEDLAMMMWDIDTDENGTIDFTEFLKAMSRKPRKGLREAFKEFDEDGDGFISSAELRQGIENSGQKITDTELDELIRLADVDGNGRVDYEEFMKMMT